MEQELTITNERKAGVFVLHLAGDLTKTAGEQLLQYYDQENGLKGHSADLLFDFTDVSYMNSAGIAVLIRIVRLGAQEQQKAGCYGLSYHYEKLFRMVGLTRWMTIYPSEWAAIDDMKKN